MWDQRWDEKMFRTKNSFMGQRLHLLAHDGFLLLNFVHPQTFQHLSQTELFSRYSLSFLLIDYRHWQVLHVFQFSTYYLYTCYVLEQDEFSIREVYGLSSLESLTGGKLSLNVQYLNLISITVYLLEISFNQNRSSVSFFEEHFRKRDEIFRFH